MKEDMDLMAHNGVLDLVELPERVKFVGCKWVYKSKRDSVGNIEHYKARLVTKRFTQKEGVDYHKSLSPDSKDSFRIIMTLVAHFDWSYINRCENTDLDEVVYMTQPEGFNSSQGDPLVCRLKKPYMDRNKLPANGIYI